MWNSFSFDPFRIQASLDRAFASGGSFGFGAPSIFGGGAPAFASPVGGFGSPFGFGGFNQGHGFGGFNQGHGFGGFNQGHGFGGFNQEPGFGGFNQGPGFGGFNQEPGFGGFNQEPGFNQGPSFGGFNQGHGFGGFNQESGFGGFNQGPSFGGFNQGHGFGGFNQEPGFGGTLGLGGDDRPSTLAPDARPLVTEGGQRRPMVTNYADGSGPFSGRSPDGALYIDGHRDSTPTAASAASHFPQLSSDAVTASQPSYNAHRPPPLSNPGGTSPATTPTSTGTPRSTSQDIFPSPAATSGTGGVSPSPSPTSSVGSSSILHYHNSSDFVFDDATPPSSPTSSLDATVNWPENDDVATELGIDQGNRTKGP